MAPSTEEGGESKEGISVHVALNGTLHQNDGTDNGTQLIADEDG